MKELTPTFFDECPKRSKCPCGICKVCGFRKHVSLHGPYTETATGRLILKPWSHAFENVIPVDDSSHE